MGSLKIGLVTSSNTESDLLVKLLESKGAELIYNIPPEAIADSHVEDEKLHVWLLNVDDESWHDTIDHLLDESEVPVYFSEPGSLAKQSHPDFWCSNLIDRLYEITGLEKEYQQVPPLPSPAAATNIEKPETASQNEVVVAPNEPETPLASALDELELSTVGLPSDIAAELVSELESLKPVLQVDPAADLDDIHDNIPQSQTEDEIAVSNKLQIDQEPGEVDSGSDLEAESEIELSSLDGFELDGLELENLELEGLDLSDSDENEIEAETETDIETGTESVPQNEALSEFDIELADFCNDESPGEVTNYTADNENNMDLSLPEQQSDELIDTCEEELVLETEQPLREIQTELSFDNEFGENDNNSAIKHEIDEPSELTLVLDDPSNRQDEPPVNYGRAKYTIDESDELPQDQETEQSKDTQPENGSPDISNDDDHLATGLSLEPIEDELKVNGVANFLDESLDNEKVAEGDSSIEIATVEEEIDLEQELSLVAIEGENQQQAPAWLTDNKLDLVELGDDEDLIAEDILNKGVEEEIIDEEPGPVFESSAGDESIDELVSNAEMSLNIPPIQSDILLDSELSLGDDDKADLLAEIMLEEPALEPEINEPAMSEPASNGPAINGSVINGSAINEMATADPVPDDILLEEYQPGDSDREMHTIDLQTKLEPELGIISDIDDDIASEPVAAFEVDESAGIEIGDFEIPMLDETASDIEFEEYTPLEEIKFTPCWVIGASLGGPAAVKRFLQCIPPDINASFIITQHIDENFLPVLAEILTNNSPFEVKVANGSHEMLPGKMFIAPLKGKVVFLKDGSMLVDHSQKWSDPYSPCIDDVLESVSHVYGDLAGAIIFSGMGQDGLNGARKMRQRGGLVWAQTTETCANASMPETVIKNGEVDYIGTPEQLAQKLVAFLSEREMGIV